MKTKRKSLKKAVIYCRVSSTKQTTQGHGLNSQETRCREYAKYKHYDVVKIFGDDMSGSLTARPGMLAMLSFLKQHKKQEEHVVIIDDISRLARGLEAHLQLRADISAAGGVLESPSIEFGEDSDSILVENLLASVSQHQRQKNAEQVVNRMKARLMNGYWVFHAPVGYKYERKTGQGKVLVRDEPNASIMQEAFEGYASNRFVTQMQMKRFLDMHPTYPKDKNGEVNSGRIKELLTRPIYAGYVEAPNWGVGLTKGNHDPIISFETYQRIQKKLEDKGYIVTQNDYSDDFPLRGFVNCGHCERPLTSGWSKGRSKYYAYYLCGTKGCPDSRKSIKREVIESEFEELLASLTPTDNLFNIAHKMPKKI